jgi:hypothetical protein
MKLLGMEIPVEKLGKLKGLTGLLTLSSDQLTAQHVSDVFSAIDKPISPEFAGTLLAKVRTYGDGNLVEVLSSPVRSAEIGAMVEAEFNPPHVGPQVTRCPNCAFVHEA